MPAASSNGALSAGGVDVGEIGVAAKASTKNISPPKTDKPRPHVCATCSRPFARLEHLKRHERSHTKEKPFECPECQRCFARRDLLLRHQQKVHSTVTPSRRGSVAVGPARVRKGSIASSNAPTMRPRANTISHVDSAHPYLSTTSSNAPARTNINHGHSRHPSLLGLPMHNDYAFGGMSAAMGQRGSNHGLPRLDTNALNVSTYGGGLRTAPVNGGFDTHFEYEGLLYGPGNTVNPNALHYSDSPQSMAMDTTPPYQQNFSHMPQSQSLDENFDWLNGFEHHMSFDSNNEQAIDESPPSAISTASQSGISEVMLNGSNQPVATSSVWQQAMMAPPLTHSNPFNMDIGSANFDMTNESPVSPHSLQPGNPNDSFLSNPPSPIDSMSPSRMHSMTAQNFSTIPSAP